MTQQQKEKRREARCNSTQQVVAELKANAPEMVPHARVVGVWVWIQTPSKPEARTREVLKELGFSWNSKRAAWQHPCGYFRPVARGYDPRLKYGEARIKEDERKLALA